MICDIIKDLMPLYVADECSPASKEAVDAHVWSCDACRASLDAMLAPVALTPAVVDEKDTPKVEAMNFKKGFKKIRRRWLVSIVCLLMLFPLSGLGILGVNEVRGEGYAFSNLSAAYQTDAFMRKIIAKDYEGAVGMLDVAGWYETIVTAEQTRDYYADQFHRVQSGDAWYYSRLQTGTDRLAYFLETGESDAFWAQIIIDNAEIIGMQNPIPAEEMAEAAKIVLESTGKEVKIITMDSEELDNFYTYVEEVAPDGNSYYFPSLDTRSQNYDDWTKSSYYPETMYFEFIDEIFPQLTGTALYSKTYEKLGYEEYSRLFKEQYCQGMRELESQGNYVTGYSIDRIYGGSGTFEDENGVQQSITEWCFDISIESTYSSSKDVKALTSIDFSNGRMTIYGAGYLIQGNGEIKIQQLQLLDVLSGNLEHLDSFFPGPRSGSIDLSEIDNG